MFRVVIPARYDSTRLPGKALLPIAGKPMVQWVYERARAAGAVEVLIATDDERIAHAASGFGVAAVLTSRAHASGTDRIAEVARARRWAAGDIVVNLQGDEPLMPPAVIVQVATLLAGHPEADIATVATPIATSSTQVEELLDPNIVKVVTDARGMALYFSRAPIPWSRRGAHFGPAGQGDAGGPRRHRGLYAYRTGSLLRLAELPQGALEVREQLEQLRALEHGMSIVVADAQEEPGPDVNTREDLDLVARRLGRGRS